MFLYERLEKQEKLCYNKKMFDRHKEMDDWRTRT